MNGIIHNCTHGNNPNTTLSEAEMFLGIFRYIENVFDLIRPQKVFMMAVDGCAPRAKMNQQRSRRFRAARDLADSMKQAGERGEEVPAEPFDSNCITPGTAFMGRLHSALLYWTRRKVAEDSSWQKIQVIFSGHDVPGEGEHKIMEYIRTVKMQPGFNPNTRHCMLGNDADLIMLALVSHEPHFALLREKIDFKANFRKSPSRADKFEKSGPKEFQLLHISMLRDYIAVEFSDCAATLSFPYDVERIIDDFVLMAYFVGNDFLPHIPCLDISTGAFAWLVEIYRRLLSSWSSYMTNNGDIDLQKLEQFFKHLAVYEEKAFTELEAHRASLRHTAKYVSTSTGSGAGNATVSVAGEDSDVESFENRVTGAVTYSLQTSSEVPPHLKFHDISLSVSAEEEWKQVASRQTSHRDPDWREKYYESKLHIKPTDEAALKRLRHKYIEGVIWCYHYYYHGVCSWGWFYPFHYAPLVCDLTDLESLDYELLLGKPFTPFEQLLAVLPSLSSRLLPEPFQKLMLDAGSPIRQYYPDNFDIDMEGRRNPWEGVVLIPFIDEELLRRAFLSIDMTRLSSHERARNALGHPWILRFSPDTPSFLPAAIEDVLPAVSQCASTASAFDAPKLAKGIRFKPCLLPGTLTQAHARLGFPSIFSMEITHTVRNVGVTSCGMRSKKESIIVHLNASRCSFVGSSVLPDLTARDVSAATLHSLVGKEILFGWPYFREGRVVAILDAQQSFFADPKQKDSLSELGALILAKGWSKAASLIQESYLSSKGISVGDVGVVLVVSPFTGMSLVAGGGAKKMYSKDVVEIPLQLTRPFSDGFIPDTRFVEIKPVSSSSICALPNPEEALQQRFALGSTLLYLGGDACGPEFIGRSCSVTGYARSKLVVLFRVQGMQEMGSAWAASIMKQEVTRWFPTFQVSSILKMNAATLSRVCSSLKVSCLPEIESADLGLGLKFEKRNLCVPGFARKNADERFELSEHAVLILNAYRKYAIFVFVLSFKFLLFDYLCFKV
jgi:5'-3' exoribonuclease 1